MTLALIEFICGAVLLFSAYHLPPAAPEYLRYICIGVAGYSWGVGTIILGLELSHGH